MQRRPAGVRAARPADPRRLALGVQLGDEPDAVAPGTFPPDEVPTPVPRRLRPQRQRQPLAHQPRGAADRLRPDHRHRGGGAHDAHPDRPDPGPRSGSPAPTACPATKFNRRLLQRVALGNRQYLGELWRDSLVQLCDAAPGGLLVGSSGPVDVSGACDPLRDWNLRDDLDSAGAILFRRFASNLLGNFQCVPTGLQGATCPGAELLYTTPYSNSDPVNTPCGPEHRRTRWSGSRSPTRSPTSRAPASRSTPALRGYQYETRGGEQIPIHGGPGGLGVFNAISAVWDPDAGYPDVRHGSSFIMAAEFRKGRCPVEAGTFVTYGQTENQSSPQRRRTTRGASRASAGSTSRSAPARCGAPSSRPSASASAGAEPVA